MSNIIIQNKKTGVTQKVPADHWQTLVTRGVAKNWEIIERNAPDVPVEIAEVISKMKEKAAKPTKDIEAEPDGEAPGNSNQNDKD